MMWGPRNDGGRGEEGGRCHRASRAEGREGRGGGREGGWGGECEDVQPVSISMLMSDTDK